MNNYWKILLVLGCMYFVSCITEPDSQNDYKAYELQGLVKQLHVIDENGKVVTDATFSQKGQLLREQSIGQQLEYEYENNRIARLKIYGGNNELDAQRVYTYSKNNVLQEVREFDTKKNYKKRLKYTYDSRGNVLRAELLSVYNDSIYVWEYEYTKDNLIAKERTVLFEPDGKFIKTQVYEYDDANLVKEILEFEDDDVLMRKRVFGVFHEFPLPTKLYSYWKGEVYDSLKYEYIFDSKGNWVTREIVTPVGKRKVTRRKIMYY